MLKEKIIIKGARTHNLKNIDLEIPKNKLIVITGISGSGKSSLAFDTLYAEGQRRYVESLSAYARQFLGVMDKPDVDKIEGICPSIAIEQKKSFSNPRSTVGTMTEIYDYLRLLFAKIGIPYCPKCNVQISAQTIDQIKEKILKLEKKSKILILGPVISGKKGEHQSVLEEIKKMGFSRVRVDRKIVSLEEALEKPLARYKIHNIEVVVDQLDLDETIDKLRLSSSLEMALKIGKGIVIIFWEPKKKKEKSKDFIFSQHFFCPLCGFSLPPLEPRLFSFNSPFGACPHCQGLGKKLIVDPNLVIPNPRLSLAEGAIFAWARASHKVGRQSFFWYMLRQLAERENIDIQKPVKDLSKDELDIVLYGDGIFPGVIPWIEKKYYETDSDFVRQELEKYMVEKECPFCQGKRLKKEALSVKIGNFNISDLSNFQLDHLKKFFEKDFFSFPESVLSSASLKVAKPIVKEILKRLQFLIDLGLNYLTLDRTTNSLSGGEEQRIRLATQIGSGLTGVLYILDEPSVGLHARDQGRLIDSLKKLRDLGNTVIVVEHDPQTILSADWVIEIGPLGGKNGGRVIFEGPPKKLLKSKTLTGLYLSGKRKIKIENKKEQKKEKKEEKFLIIKKASEHNLKNIDVKIPLEKFVCVTGVSGSGKSTLINDILARALFKKFYRAKEEPGKHEEILGVEFLDKVVLVDQTPIGRTPRSNPATFVSVFSLIRNLFAQTREAKARGYSPGRFSFNVRGGRCEHCQGQGEIKIEMYFLPDVYIQCPECKGKRFNEETLEIRYKDKNIADVLEMTVQEALSFFQNIPLIKQKLGLMAKVGLDYLQLGQPAPSLSGGEAQRVKLASELSKRDTGRTLYILDEPTTGLHFYDIEKLIIVLKELVERKNSVIVIEHNLSVIQNADWILDLGPEGGDKGGEIIAQGTVLDIIRNKKSITGQYLRQVVFQKKIL